MRNDNRVDATIHRHAPVAEKAVEQREAWTAIVFLPHQRYRLSCAPGVSDAVNNARCCEAVPFTHCPEVAIDGHGGLPFFLSGKVTQMSLLPPMLPPLARLSKRKRPATSVVPAGLRCGQ